jgi:hypothetical protein
MINRSREPEGDTAMSFYILMGTHEFNGVRYIELQLPKTTRHFWSSDFQLISEHAANEFEIESQLDQMAKERAWYIQGEILGNLS